METENYRIKINDNIFHVQKSVSKIYTKKDIPYEFLKIGGKDMCVEYKYDKKNPTYAELQWLHTDNRKCVEGNMEIKKENTVFLFWLSVQLLKKYIPVSKIEFLDNSHFVCKLPNQSTVKIFLNHYSFLFYNGHTWYDTKFGAYPLDENQRNIYFSFSENFDNPECKPISFDFMNDGLNDLFQPIWQKTKTWKEFLQKINKIPDICQKSYPWYLKASNIIRKNQPLPEKWMIDCDKMKNIEFVRINGGRKKNFSTFVYDISICCDYPNNIDCRNMTFC